MLAHFQDLIKKIQIWGSRKRDQQVRRLNIHEYQAMKLLSQYGVPIPKSDVATSPEEAGHVAESLGGLDYVVKAQVLAGGRGKGKFLRGFQGGVQLCSSKDQVKEVAGKMIGDRLVTKQTGPEGKPCNKVLVAERLYLRREVYVAILLDRQAMGPVIVASPRGGMNIEEVAQNEPNQIFKEAVDLGVGLKKEQAESLASKLGFDAPATKDQVVQTITNLYKMFLKTDATLVEINPMGETHDGKIRCMDIKINIDDNADFRQKELFAMRDKTQEDSREARASENGLNYIGLDGDIGCLVNGAGLAMATMDSIKLFGGNPANFLDLGGAANAGQVTAAFNLLNNDRNVKAVLVNIFGGIMRCDTIAMGLIRAVQELGLKKPLVVRLQGTNVEAARKLIDDSGLRILTADDLNDAAQRVVRVVQIMKMAEEAHVNVSFELPL